MRGGWWAERVKGWGETCTGGCDKLAYGLSKGACRPYGVVLSREDTPPGRRRFSRIVLGQ